MEAAPDRCCAANMLPLNRVMSSATTLSAVSAKRDLVSRGAGTSAGKERLQS